MAGQTIGAAWAAKFGVDTSKALFLNFATDGLGPGSVPLELGVKHDRASACWLIMGGDPRRNFEFTRIFHMDYITKASTMSEVEEACLAFLDAAGKMDLVVVNSLRWNQRSIPAMFPWLWAVIRRKPMVGMTEAVLAAMFQDFDLTEARDMQAGADKAASIVNGMPGYSKRKLKELCLELGVEASLEASGLVGEVGTVCRHTLDRLSALYARHLSEPLKN